jgi:hypothetical protein
VGKFKINKPQQYISFIFDVRFFEQIRKELFFVVKKSIKFEVDDFLDLYLLAEQLGDKGWQEEIIKQLKIPTQETVEENQLLTIHNLWLEYKSINIDILELYNKLKYSTTEEDLLGKINELKEKRLSLTHKISKEERKLQHSYQ